MLVSTKSRTVQMSGSSCSGANGGASSGATIAIGSPVRWKRYTARICRSPAGGRKCVPNGSASMSAAPGAARSVIRSSIRMGLPTSSERGRGSIPFGQGKLSRAPVNRDKPQGPAWTRGSMASRPLLYSMDISHYCIAADRMLAFKGVAFDPRPVPYHDKQELIKATGQDYVPTLVWDGKIVAWQDIPDFLEAAQPKPTLYPWGQKGLATLLEHWGHQVLEERVWRYVVTKVPPVLHDDGERWVFEEMQTRARGPWHVLEMRREEFRQDMNKHLAMVETTLEGREWILGQPSLADFGIYGSMSPLLTVGEAVPDEFPRLAAWAGRIRALG